MFTGVVVLIISSEYVAAQNYQLALTVASFNEIDVIMFTERIFPLEKHK